MGGLTMMRMVSREWLVNPNFGKSLHMKSPPLNGIGIIQSWEKEKKKKDG